jgi:cytochrome c oxidase subunit 2
MNWFTAANPVLNPASPQARALLSLLTVTMIVCAVIFLIVVVYAVWCMVKFRRRGPGEPRQVTGNSTLEISWTVGSILTLVFLFVLMVRAMHIADAQTERAPDVTVIGHQWWWEVRYPNGIVTANEIHIPVKSDVLVDVQAADVIHSFWVPQLGRKIDAVPGHPNRVWIRADTAGDYAGACSEFCGAQHAWMRILVMAQEPDAFHDWSAQQLLPAKAAATPTTIQGEKLFLSKTCVSCHAIRGVSPATVVGPDLTHFAGRQTIGAGVLQNNAANLRHWLANPQKIKPGCLMPDFRLRYPEVDNLAAFLETLQ